MPRIVLRRVKKLFPTRNSFDSERVFKLKLIPNKFWTEIQVSWNKAQTYSKRKKAELWWPDKKNQGQERLESLPSGSLCHTLEHQTPMSGCRSWDEKKWGEKMRSKWGPKIKTYGCRRKTQARLNVIWKICKFQVTTVTCTRASHDWSRFYFWLDEQVVQCSLGKSFREGKQNQLLLVNLLKPLQKPPGHLRYKKEGGTRRMF